MRMMIALLASILFTSAAMAASIDDDVAGYIKIFNGPVSDHRDAAERLRWIGLSDTRLFDVIEKRLLTESTQGGLDMHDNSRLERYIRALGFSGQEKYEPTLNSFASQPRFNKAATAALHDLSTYKVWDPIISNRNTFDPKYSDEVNRIMNMLRADDVFLNELGAKRIYFDAKDDYLLDFLAKQVKANYRRTERQFSDAFAWQIKALSSSQNQKYKDLIEEVAANASLPAVRRHAQIGLKRDYEIPNQ